MVAVISAASIVAYIFSMIKFKGKWVEQQIVFSMIYLVGLTVIGEMDVLLPIYIVVSLFPFLKHIRKISISTGTILVYFGLYLVYGLIAQNAVSTLVTFASKIWQLIIFFIVYDSDINIEKEDYKKIIGRVIITETLLGLYLMLTSTMLDSNGFVRLVSNAQPITGNISTVALPISVYYYLQNKGNSKQTNWILFANMIMLVWIVLSGTRGYTLEFAATMVLIFYDYFTNKEVGSISQRNRMITIVVIGIIAVVCIVAVPVVLETIVSLLRLKSSVGIRTYENKVAVEFVKNAPLFTTLCGIGFGGQGGSYIAMRTALYRQINLGMWHGDHYLYDSGAIFHNLYANVLMCLGVLGIIVLVCINILVWKRITYSCADNVQIRRIMHLYQLSFLFMNYYRWSAVCGISEMILLALILKLIKRMRKDPRVPVDKKH